MGSRYMTQREITKGDLMTYTIKVVDELVRSSFERMKKNDPARFARYQDPIFWEARRLIEGARRDERRRRKEEKAVGRY